MKKMVEKRKNNSGGNDRRKKYRVVSGLIEPSTSGIFITCNRHQEKKCQQELGIIFREKYEEWYKDVDADGDGEEEQEEEEELSIEDSIKKELEEIKNQAKPSNKKEPLSFIDVGCECIVFCKTRRPIKPAEFVERLCKEASESQVKSTRFTQKLTPITFSVSASVEELKKLCERVLDPVFKDTEGLKFAIKVSSRNFNTIDRMDIIKQVASHVGNKHSVDLKNYDKLILIECFKNNIGMSVVSSDYDKLQKFNLQQIFIKSFKDKKTKEEEEEGRQEQPAKE